MVPGNVRKGSFWGTPGEHLGRTQTSYYTLFVVQLSLTLTLIPLGLGKLGKPPV